MSNSRQNTVPQKYTTTIFFNYLVYSFIELCDDVTPGRIWQLRVENAHRNAKLFEVQLNPVALVHRVYKNDCLATDQLELEERIHQNEFVLKYPKKK